MSTARVLVKKKTRVVKVRSAGIAVPTRKPVDDRVRRSREAVLNATVDLLFERGYGGATVDEVARRSGVAKTTIYRHWPTRAELLRDACSTIGTPLRIPETGSLTTDLGALIADLAEALRSARWASVLPSIIDEAERDPEIAAMYGTLQRGYSAPFEVVLESAVRRRELPMNADINVLIAALTGPLFYRRWFSREPITEAFCTQIIRRVVG